MRYLVITLSIFSLLTLGSCVKSEELLPPTESIDGNIITFTINDFDGVETRAKFLSTEEIAQSRAMANSVAMQSNDETKVSSLAVFLYNMMVLISIMLNLQSSALQRQHLRVRQLLQCRRLQKTVIIKY